VASNYGRAVTSTLEQGEYMRFIKTAYDLSEKGDQYNPMT